MTPMHSRIVWTVFGLFATAFLLAADKPSAVSSPQKTLQTGEAAIEKALQQPVDLMFNETPLADVVKSLRERCGIEIQLDERSLADANITSKTPVTCEVRGTPLRSALNLMLRNFGEDWTKKSWLRTLDATLKKLHKGRPEEKKPWAVWTIKDDVLLITSADENANILSTKVYDVSDLVVFRDKNDALWDNYDSLIDMIETGICQNNWQNNGGSGSISGVSLGTAKILVVSQTYQIQGEVADLLEKIRKIAKKTPNKSIPRRDPSPVFSAGYGMGLMAINDSPFEEENAKSLKKKSADARPNQAKSPLPSRKPLQSGRAAIEKALEKPVDFQFDGIQLSDVVEYLRDRYEIEIQLDEKPLGEASITRETPITSNLRGVSLRSALDLELRKIGVTWIIKNDVLLITTLEERDNNSLNLLMKVYDVSDLVVCRDDHDALWDDYDTLVKMIQTIIQPNNWAENGGLWAIAGSNLGTAKALAVTATDDGHERIAELFKNIREIAQKNPNAGPPRRNRPPAKPAVLPENATPATAGTPATSERTEEKKPGVAKPNPQPAAGNAHGDGMF